MISVNTHIAKDLWDSIASQFQFKESTRYLAHYTTAPAATRILQTGELWARDTATFDPRHVEGHRQLFAAEAVRLYRKAGPEPNASFRKALSDQFSDPVLAPRFFAACLGMDTDSPHMWRAYGDDGNGVALIIDSQLVNRDLKVIAAPCVYERAAQLDLFANLMERCDALAVSLPDEEKAELLPHATALANMLLQAYKHLYLSPERECRYVYMEHDGQSYPRLDAPHPERRALPLVGAGTASPFVCVVSGPCRTDEIDADFREQLCSAGYSNMPVTRSTVDIASLTASEG